MHSESKDIELSLEEYKKISNSSDEEKLEFLKRFWRLDSNKLIGSISINTPFSEEYGTRTLFWLENIKTNDGRTIYYPKINTNGELIYDKVDKIYIGTNLTNFQSKVYNFAEIEFEIANELQQSIQQNPLLIKGNNITLQLLEAIPKQFLIEDNDRILIYESLKSAYWDKIREVIEKEQQRQFENLRQYVKDDWKDEICPDPRIFKPPVRDYRPCPDWVKS